MADVLFYHLEQRPLESVLPALLEKVIERGWRAVVEVGSIERARSLDTALWTYRDDSFLPHGLAGNDNDADQPVLLTTGTDNLNSATVRFFTDRAVPATADGYELSLFRPRPGCGRRSPRRLEGAPGWERRHLLAAGQFRALGEKGLDAPRAGQGLVCRFVGHGGKPEKSPCFPSPPRPVGTRRIWN
jgi:DNA polymerase-3 subunit chi